MPLVVIMTNFKFDPEVLIKRKNIHSLADLKVHKILVSTLGLASYWL